MSVIGVVTRTDLVTLFLDEQNTSATKKKAHRLAKRNVQRILRLRTPKECVKALEIVGQLADEMGVSVYVVGGFVRDLIMDREKWRWPNMDIDLVVEGDGIVFAYYLAELLGGRVREHKEFMTAIVLFRPAGCWIKTIFSLTMRSRSCVSTLRQHVWNIIKVLPCFPRLNFLLSEWI